MPGMKSTGILLLVLSTTSVYIAGIMSLTGAAGIAVGPHLIGYPLIPATVGMLIALVVLVHPFQPRRLSMNKP
jgi:hypothetical protein